MPLESALDFNAYVDTTTGHGVTATFFEVQQSLWDDFPLIDTLFDIDSGFSKNINIIIDQEYFNIEGGSVPVVGYQPRAIIKSSDVPYISQEDKLVVSRARKIQKFLSQPFHVAEVFTGSPGKFVSLEDTIKGFEGLVNGDYDDITENAFYMVGTIEEALEKAKKMEEDAA